MSYKQSILFTVNKSVYIYRSVCGNYTRQEIPISGISKGNENSFEKLRIVIEKSGVKNRGVWLSEAKSKRTTSGEVIERFEKSKVQDIEILLHIYK